VYNCYHSIVVVTCMCAYTYSAVSLVTVDCIAVMVFTVDMHHSLYAMSGIDFDLNVYII
jgi:hypothetical protein